jgi:hypothetical protein
LPGSDALAYLASLFVTKKKRDFIRLTPEAFLGFFGGRCSEFGNLRADLPELSSRFPPPTADAEVATPGPENAQMWRKTIHILCGGLSIIRAKDVEPELSRNVNITQK